MNRNLGSEALLLTVPVLLLGAGLVLKMKGVTPTFSWRNPLDPGPLRVEYTPFQEVNVTPLDVSHGFHWKAKTSTALAGRADVPKSWVLRTTINQCAMGLSLIYRRGAVWIPAPPLSGKANLVEQYMDFTRSQGQNILAVNLKSIPVDAQEIRLRGYLSYGQIFKGTIPPGWKPPVGLKLVGRDYRIEVDSKPFDIQIKAPDERFPAPTVSMEPEIELRDTMNFTQNPQITGNRVYRQEVFYFQMHHRKNRNWAFQPNLQLQNLHVFDGNGRELDLYYAYGTKDLVKGGNGCFSGVYSQDTFNPEKASDDLITGVFQDSVAPKNSWGSYKQPIRVEFEASDGKCWPAKIRAYFHIGAGKESQVKDFGAPPKA